MPINQKSFDALQPGVTQLTKSLQDQVAAAQDDQRKRALEEYLKGKIEKGVPEHMETIPGQQVELPGPMQPGQGPLMGQTPNTQRSVPATPDRYVPGVEYQAQEAERASDEAGARRLRQFLGKDAGITYGKVRIDPRQLPNMGLPVLTPAQEAAEKSAGKAYSDYEAEGGKANIDKNVGLLDSAANDLQHSDRGLGTRVAGILPKSLREFLTPEEVAREDKVKTAVQATLRQTLGAQFTEKEGQLLMDRAYNPRLSTEENLRRITAVANELKQKQAQMDQSANSYRKTGYATIGVPSPAAPKAAAPQAKGGLSPAEQAELEQLRKEMGR